MLNELKFKNIGYSYISNLEHTRLKDGAHLSTYLIQCNFSDLHRTNKIHKATTQVCKVTHGQDPLSKSPLRSQTNITAANQQDYGIYFDIGHAEVPGQCVRPRF